MLAEWAKNNYGDKKMSELKLDNIYKNYGKTAVINGLSLDVKDGELVTLLGPSGCGKTTTLRCVTGFLNPDKGNIFIGDKNITEIPPEKRGIGLVFQNYALWPHMTIFDNLAFGLKLKKLPVTDIKKKVMEGLSIVKLDGFQDRYPRELSGGQQQRVALARAIVLEPDILLLDEPLSNLDALLREQMRFEIGQIHKNFGITTIYVTHDQTEAMVISDKIVILDKGIIMQQGTPSDIYSKPQNKFVAGFMGTTNFISGNVESVSGDRIAMRTKSGKTVWGIGVVTDNQASAGKNCDAAVRTENISFCSSSETGENIFSVVVNRASYTGEVIDYELEFDGIMLRAKSRVKERASVGDSVHIRIDSSHTPILFE